MPDIDKTLLGKEFDRLTNGITKTENNVSTSKTILYSTVSAFLVLAFGSEKNESLFFLTPFFVIIPMFLLCKASVYNMHRLAAYQIVFIESNTKELNWETRLYYLYFNKGEGVCRKFTGHTSLPFIITSVICMIIFYYYLFIVEKELAPNVIKLKFYFGTFWFLVVVVITLTQKTALELKKHYIQKWIKIKQLAG